MQDVLAQPESYLDDSLTRGCDFCAHKHYQLIHFLTDVRVRPTQFPHSVLGLGQYLEAVAVRHFSALEVVRPKYPQHLAEAESFEDPMQGRVLLPARWAWPRLVAPLVLLEIARKGTGPITLRHAYRPPEYNRRCGSKAEKSDHIYCCAVDVAFADRGDLMYALHHVINPRWQLPEFGLSVGYNGHTGSNLHLGIWAPETERVGRPRIWKYGAD
jgi:hypothetical protein